MTETNDQQPRRELVDAGAVIARVRAVMDDMASADSRHNHHPFDPGGETDGLGCDACWRAQLQFAIEPPARHTRWTEERAAQRFAHLLDDPISNDPLTGILVPLRVHYLHDHLPLLGRDAHGRRRYPVDVRTIEVPDLGNGSGWVLAAVDQVGTRRVVGLEYVAHDSECADPECMDVWNRRIFEDAQLPEGDMVFAVQPGAFITPAGHSVDYLVHASDLPDSAYVIEGEPS